MGVVIAVIVDTVFIMLILVAMKLLKKVGTSGSWSVCHPFVILLLFGLQEPTYGGLSGLVFCYCCLFLDASSHLHKRPCPSVGLSVGPLVRPFVGNAFVEVDKKWIFPDSK